MTTLTREIPEPTEPDKPVQASTVLSPGITSNALWNEGVRVGGSAISTRMDRYKASANENDFDWEPTRTQFEEITARDCHYCGSSPDNSSKHGRRQFIYNGIDRVDNRRGYTLDNIVPCCKQCNSAKGNREVSEFWEWARRITNRSP